VSTHVVIVGAGFAGQAALDRLAKGRSDLRMTIIDENLYSMFQPLLYQVATGGLNPGDVSYPVGGFAGPRKARYLQGSLASIDTAAQKITLADGRMVDYDYLILATGVTAAFFGVTGAAEHSFALYTRRDAQTLRDHIMAGLEMLSASDPPDVAGSPSAERVETAREAAGDNPAERKLAVTVVGGGPTGVELAGTLAELRRAVLRATFPDIDPARVNITMVEMAPELLMPFHEKLRRYTLRQLIKRGVEIRLNTQVLAVEPGLVKLSGGESLPSDLTVWASGVAAPAAVAGWGVPQGQHGRITVGPDLRVVGQERIFAAGDIAIYADNPSPQLSAPALQEGKHAGEQIRRLIAGQPTQPFHYHDKGMVATIGRSAAVVELSNGIRMTGLLAWLGWLGLHLFYLLGFRNRIQTLINLSWRYIAWGHGGGVIVGDDPSVSSKVPVVDKST
jgi:NADH:ubiquinone reductase (H+-translocating)